MICQDGRSELRPGPGQNISFLVGNDLASVSHVQGEGVSQAGSPQFLDLDELVKLMPILRR